MYFFMSVKIWFLVKTLWTILEITRVWSFTCMDYFMTNQSWLKIKFLLAIIIRTCVCFRLLFIMRIWRWNFIIVLIIFFRFSIIMPAFHNSIISSIAGNTVILLTFIGLLHILIIIGRTVNSNIKLIRIIAIFREHTSLILWLMRMLTMILLTSLFFIDIKRAFGRCKIHGNTVGSILYIM